MEKMLLYCTKAKPYLYFGDDLGEDEYGMIYNPQWLLTTDSCFDKDYAVNGKIIGECDYEIEEIKHYMDCGGYFWYYTQKFCDRTLEGKTKLSQKDINNYLKGKTGYAIHIKNLHIFSKPRELKFYYQKYKNDKHLYNVEQAPQNMMRVIGKQGNKYILTSIHPEYLCEILNGRKTIEVRRKVLKEMIR